VITALKSLVAEFPKLKAKLPQELWASSEADAMQEESPRSKTIRMEVLKMKTKKDFLTFYAEKMDIKVEELTDADKAVALSGTKFAVADDPKDDPAYITAADISPLQEQIAGFEKTLNEVLRYAQDTPAIRDAGYISGTGGRSDEKVYSFADFLIAVARDDKERLKTIYKSKYISSEEAEKADMSHIDGVGGAYLLPTEFENNLLKMSEQQSPLQNMVTKVPVGSNRGQWPSLDQFTAPTAGVGDTAFAGKVTAASTPENTALTETRPEFKRLEWNIHKIGGYTEVPNELINDSPMSIEQLLNALFAIAINAKVEYSIFRGTGANEPLGILNAACLIAMTTTTNSVFALKDALNMVSRFHPFLSNGAFFMHPGVVPDLSDFEAGTGGSVWLMDQKNDPVIGQPILGKPVYLSQHLPQDDNSGDVVLADMKAYLLFMRQGMQIAFSEHVSFKSDQGVFRFTQRMDGQPWLAGAITLADPQGSYTVSAFVKHHD
jgi:HK97 family phage major capsid protein